MDFVFAVEDIPTNLDGEITYSSSVNFIKPDLIFNLPEGKCFVGFFVGTYLNKGKYKGKPVISQNHVFISNKQKIVLNGCLSIDSKLATIENVGEKVTIFPDGVKEGTKQFKVTVENSDAADIDDMKLINDAYNFMLARNQDQKDLKKEYEDSIDLKMLANGKKRENGFKFKSKSFLSIIGNCD